MPHDGRTSNSY